MVFITENFKNSTEEIQKLNHKNKFPERENKIKYVVGEIFGVLHQGEKNHEMLSKYLELIVSLQKTTNEKITNIFRLEPDKAKKLTDKFEDINNIAIRIANDIYIKINSLIQKNIHLEDDDVLLEIQTYIDNLQKIHQLITDETKRSEFSEKLRSLKKYLYY